jgi:hypothetical protein
MHRFPWAVPAVAIMTALGSPSIAAAADEKTPAEEANKRICRAMPTTGWRTQAVRVCRTRAEWIDWARQNKMDVSDVLKTRGRVTP